MAVTPGGPLYGAPVDIEWLSLHQETVAEADLPIVDAHQHFFEVPGRRYLLDDLLVDAAGHNLLATVFIECGCAYLTEGPEAFRAVGETRFVYEIAKAAQLRGAARVAAGIVAHLDFRNPQAHSVALAHMEAGRGLLRGIRQSAAWHPNPALRPPGRNISEGLFRDPAFREGFKVLEPLDLSFEAWLYPDQFDDLVSLASAFPSTRIMLDFAPPLRLGGPDERAKETFDHWRENIRKAAGCENILLKLGGIGMGVFGFRLFRRPRPPSARTLAKAWKPYFDTCLDAFGAGRCMIGSNFPVDKGSFSYRVFWNTCKALLAGASQDDKAAVLSGNAIRAYRIDPLRRG